MRFHLEQEVLDLSKHTCMKDLVATGHKRRKESECGFCKWMTAGPCGNIYEAWDDCVFETKEVGVHALFGISPLVQRIHLGPDNPWTLTLFLNQVDGRNFVDVCRPFTVALMACIEKHPDYYEELAKKEGEKKKERAKAAEMADKEWEWKAEVSLKKIKPIRQIVHGYSAVAGCFGQNMIFVCRKTRVDHRCLSMTCAPQVDALASAPGVLSAAAPGEWAGKEGKHVPVVVFSGDRASISVRIAFRKGGRCRDSTGT